MIYEPEKQISNKSLMGWGAGGVVKRKRSRGRSGTWLNPVTGKVEKHTPVKI